MTPRRILLINHEYPPLGGGGANATYHIAHALAKLGHQPFVLTAAWGRLPRIEYADGITVRRIFAFRQHKDRCSVPEMIAFMLSAGLVAPGLARHWRPDVVLAFAGIPSGPVGWLLKRTNGAPYAIALQGGDVPGFDVPELARWRKLASGVLRRIWQDAGAVVASSQGFARLAHRHAPDQPIGVIPAGADVDGIAPKETYIAGPELRLLFVGRLVHQKGLDILIQALAKLPHTLPWRLVLAGDGPEWTRLAGLAGRFNFADRMHVRGWLDKAALPPIYRSADVFVLPAREDGMPIALLEAMAAGLPIIASKVSGMSEAVIDGINGLLVAKDDIDGWVKALTTLAENPAQREVMGRASRVRAETYFSWAAVTRTWVDVLEHIIEKPAGGRPT